ncbi:glycosyltransferase family 39 protein [bacterium]|nr:glycosyltransferase family 39 protein [bacterium]
MDENKKFFSNSELLPFFIIFALSLFVRIYAANTSIAQIYPDEIFQTLEPAHKLAFGRGITFWEFNVGARSWFLPGILAGVYKILDFFGVKDPLSINIGIKIFLSIFSSLSVSVLYLAFRRHNLAKKEAFIFTLPVAASYLLSYISARTLSESASLPFMVFAVYFATCYLENENKKELFFAFLAAGTAYMIRFQTCIFSFGLALALFLTSKKRFQASLIFGFGFLGMMLVQGILDIFTWGSFFKSLLTYLDYNILRGVADNHGVMPWHFYIADFITTFHPITLISALLTMVLGVMGFKKNRRIFLFFFPFLFFFTVHCAIGHKEPRFVFACHFTVLALSAGFFAGLVQKYGKNRKNGAIFLSVFLLFSLDAFPHIKYAPLWNHSVTSVDNFYGNDQGIEKRFGGVLETEAELGRIADLKRAYLFGIPTIWSGGYAYFHKNAKILFASRDADIRQFMREAHDSAWQNCWFAFRNGLKIPDEYRENLEKMSNNGEFTIYRLKVEDSLRTVAFKNLPIETKNGAKWSEKGNIIMGKSGVEVTFGEVVTGRTLKIALDSSDSYRLTFFNGGEETGTLLVLPQKKQRGMFNHTKKLPETCIDKGFDAIKIVPVESDDSCSLGAIKVR